MIKAFNIKEWQKKYLTEAGPVSTKDFKSLIDDAAEDDVVFTLSDKLKGKYDDYETWSINSVNDDGSVTAFDGAGDGVEITIDAKDLEGGISGAQIFDSSDQRAKKEIGEPFYALADAEREEEPEEEEPEAKEEPKKKKRHEMSEKERLLDTAQTIEDNIWIYQYRLDNHDLDDEMRAKYEKGIVDDKKEISDLRKKAKALDSPKPKAKEKSKDKGKSKGSSWWDKLSDEAKKKYIAKHGEAPDVGNKIKGEGRTAKKQFNIKEWQTKHLHECNGSCGCGCNKATIKEDKGNDLADKVISNFRKALRKMTDDEVYSFREKIALAIDAKLKG